MSIKTIGQIKKGIKNLKKLKLFEDDSLDNLEKALLFKLAVKRKAKKRIMTSNVYSGSISEKIEKGKHIADFSKIEIDNDFLRETFHKMCELKKELDKEKGKDIIKIEKAIEEEKFDFKKLQDNIASHNYDFFSKLSRRLGLNDNLLHSFALSVYRPIFELCVEKKKHLIKDYEWKKGYCPFCGTNPGMAKFEKDVGRRILWCPLCGTEWTYRRIKCPFCENEKQDKLKFFYFDERSPYRVDVCEICKGYIKTFDERKKGKEEKTIFEIEDISTLYLDDIAVKEGYIKM